MPFQPPSKLPDLDRLKAVLLASGIQTQNNALYQVITQLIDYLKQSIGVLNNQVTSITPSPVNPPTPSKLIQLGNLFPQPFERRESNLITPISGNLPYDNLAANISGIWNFVNGLREFDRDHKIGFWESYALTWTATVSNPDIGDGTINSKYTIIGETLLVFMSISMGATTTYGSGDWNFSVPLSSAHRMGLGLAVESGVGSQGIGGQGIGALGATGFDLLAGTLLSPTVPHTWGASDLLQLFFVRELL